MRWRPNAAPSSSAAIFSMPTPTRVASRIRDFVAGESEPEIEEPVVIRNAHDLPDGLMPHMPPMIDWHFSEAPQAT